RQADRGASGPRRAHRDRDPLRRRARLLLARRVGEGDRVQAQGDARVVGARPQAARPQAGVTSPLSPARPPAPGRRAFLGSVGAALIAYPLGARAQQPLPDRSPRVGVLLAFANQPTARPYLRDALGEQGWVVNRNILVEARYANGQLDRLPALASELVALGLEMII